MPIEIPSEWETMILGYMEDIFDKLEKMEPKVAQIENIGFKIDRLEERILRLELKISGRKEPVQDDYEQFLQKELLTFQKDDDEEKLLCDYIR